MVLWFPSNLNHKHVRIFIYHPEWSKVEWGCIPNTNQFFNSIFFITVHTLQAVLSSEESCASDITSS